MPLNLLDLNQILQGTGIVISSTHTHSKASESYLDVTIEDDETGDTWSGTIPYQYRRTGLFLTSESEIADYLIQIKPYFKPAFISEWIEAEQNYWAENLGGDVTPLFFKALATMEWVKPDNFPANRNPQRRLQDIKEMGYTIASRQVGRGFERLLLPIPRGTATGYEVFSKSFRTKALRVLKRLNVYELSSANQHGLLPDHKFPEIRWDEFTKSYNPETMTEAGIAEKFQLLDNQRNQQKREVCRTCFQTDKRGILYGVQYFYAGDENWPVNVSKIGSNAEQGCIGCGWYDVAEWRKNWNNLLNQ